MGGGGGLIPVDGLAAAQQPDRAEIEVERRRLCRRSHRGRLEVEIRQIELAVDRLLQVGGRVDLGVFEFEVEVERGLGLGLGFRLRYGQRRAGLEAVVERLLLEEPFRRLALGGCARLTGIERVRFLIDLLRCPRSQHVVQSCAAVF